MKIATMFLLSLCFAAGGIAQQQRVEHRAYDDDSPRIPIAALASWIEEYVEDDAAAREILVLHTRLREELSTYAKPFKDARQQNRERNLAIRNSREELRHEIAEPVGDASIWRTWQVNRLRLESEFADAVKAILGEESRESWEDVIRDSRRSDLFGWLEFSYRTTFVDLAAAAHSITDPSTDTALAALGNEYELAIDARLRELQACLQDYPQCDPGSVVVQIQATQDIYRDRFADTFAFEKRRAFLAVIYAEAFPVLYRATPPELLIQALDELEGLTVDERSAVELIESQLHGELQSIDDRLLRALLRRRDMSEDESDDQYQRFLEWRDEIDGQDGLHVLHTEVSELLERRFGLILDASRSLSMLFSSDRAQSFPVHIRYLLSWHQIAHE